MCRKKLQKSGFTLVEILIVTAIVAIMSVLAVSGFTSFRQASLLDLTVDDLISQINEAHEKTLKGVGDGGVSRCYGLYFKANGEVFEPSGFWQEFVGKKTWKGEVEQWQYEGCGVFNSKNSVVAALDPAVKIVKIVLDGNVKNSDFGIRFVPPEGKVEVTTDGLTFGPSAQKAAFTLRFGEGAGAREQTFVYDLASLTTANE